MRKDWEIKSLDEIATVKGGKRVPKGYQFETTPTSHPYITVADFTEYGTVCTKNLKYISDEVYNQIKNYTISSQDIYISIAGTIGKTGLVPKSLDGANLTENACKLVLHKGIDKKFVYYFTKSFVFVQQTGINTRVAAQPKLALVRLKTITLPIPPLPDQKRIVAILDEAFEGIDRAIANAEKNLANSRELFESYLNNIFTQKGDGWVEKKLGDICELISGQHIDAKDYNTNSQGLGYLTGPSDFGVTYPTISKWTEVPKRTAVLNDILITVKGSGVGKINLLHLDEVAISRQLMAVRVKGQNIRFIYAFLSLQFYYFQSLANGAAIPGISRSDVLNLEIPIPSLDVQQEVVNSIEQYYCSAQRLETIYRQKIAALNELKQSILQKAFTGELTADTPKIVKEEIAA